jgi:hypothetical protein
MLMMAVVDDLDDVKKVKVNSTIPQVNIHTININSKYGVIAFIWINSSLQRLRREWMIPT